MNGRSSAEISISSAPSESRGGHVSTSGGGAIRLKRLAGHLVTVKSAGSDVDVASCICHDLTLESSGGRITVLHMNCGLQAQAQVGTLLSGGGDVSIGSLDGAATIRSEGGDQILQVGYRGICATVESRIWRRVALFVRRAFAQLLVCSDSCAPQQIQGPAPC